MVRRDRRPERAAATVQYAIFAPMMLALTFMGVQAAMFYHARSVATSAAQVGVEAARVQQGSATAGESAAGSYIDQVAPTLLGDAVVSGSRSATTVRIQITAPSPRILPGLRLPRIDTVAVGAVERVTQL